MPRKQYFSENHSPSHVTCRCSDKEWFPLPLDQVWDIFCAYLQLGTLSFGIRVHAFVLMSNHFHLLVSAPQGNLDKAMTYLIREVGLVIQESAKTLKPVFGEPYRASLIKSRKQYEIVYKYVYRNPIEAGLTKTVGTYPYTTLTRVLGHKKMEFPVFDNTSLIHNPQYKLKWLNAPYPDEMLLDELRLALRNPEFFIDWDIHRRS